LGRAAALTLQKAGQPEVVHVRNRARLDAVDLVDAGAEVVVGDLGELADVRGVAEQVN
jgi:NAD(P)-dependent dehydrogenase (short-subunit alcohol dehydrogenase family)